NRIMETVRQRQQRHQSDAAAHRQQYTNNPQLHKFALKFSEDMDLPTESSRICCSNGKVVLMEPTISPLLHHLFTSQNDIAKDFHNKIHFYNSAFTFAFVGVRFNHELTNAKNSIYTFRVQGSFYHQIDIKAILDEVNSYSINLQYISNFPEEDIKNLSMLIHTNIPGLNQRTHNVPTAPQVAAIWINDDVPP
ncbi:16307_t:CDS:2, partial [Acaulospora morrowiae]